jgi:hypothetical protein
MFTLIVVYQYGASQTFLFGKRDLDAKSAYDKLKIALENFRMYKNSNDNVVAISDGSGEVAIRIEQVVSISLSDYEKNFADQSDWAAYQGKLQAAHDVEKNNAKV